MLELSIDDDTARLADIFYKRFGLDLSNKDHALRRKNFFSKDLGLEPRDLLYLFFDIEKEFDIKIPESDILGNKFCTFNDIVEIICSGKSRGL